MSVESEIERNFVDLSIGSGNGFSNHAALMSDSGNDEVLSWNERFCSEGVQSLFASDIEHFGSQTDAERRVKNHRLSEGLTARVSVI
jgi:hypothetical protein